MYARLAAVLRHTAELHCGDAVVDVAQSSATSTDRYAAFVRKVRDFSTAVKHATDEDEIILCDVDMMVTGDPFDAFKHHFDLAVTSSGSWDELNSGVVMLRVRDSTRRFMRSWVRDTQRRFEDERGKRFSDQDALKHLCRIHHMRKTLEVVKLPLHLYNCQQHNWHAFSERTRFVHVKSDLRKHLFFGLPLRSPGAAPLADMWRAFDREANPI